MQVAQNVAEDGISDALKLGLGYSLAQLSQRIGRGSNVELVTMTEDEAVRATKRYVQRQYRIRFEDLAVTATEIDHQARCSTVTLAAPDSKFYVVTIRKTNTEIEILKITIQH